MFNKGNSHMTINQHEKVMESGSLQIQREEHSSQTLEHSDKETHLTGNDQSSSEV